jgi:hypothetical protein
MTIVLNEHDELVPYVQERKCCSICGNPVFYPFMVWRTSAAEDILICASCGPAIDNGFMADLIQLVATIKLRKLEPEYTLVRKLVRVLKEEGEAHKASERARLG